MPDVTASPHDEDTFFVSTRTVGCDGGGGALGHPLVFLRIEPDGEVICPYCSRRYVLQGLDARADAADGIADH